MLKTKFYERYKKSHLLFWIEIQIQITIKDWKLVLNSVLFCRINTRINVNQGQRTIKGKKNHIAWRLTNKSEKIIRVCRKAKIYCEK